MGCLKRSKRALFTLLNQSCFQRRINYLGIGFIGALREYLFLNLQTVFCIIIAAEITTMCKKLQSLETVANKK